MRGKGGEKEGARETEEEREGKVGRLWVNEMSGGRECVACKQRTSLWCVRVCVCVCVCVYLCEEKRTTAIQPSLLSLLFSLSSFYTLFV